MTYGCFNEELQRYAELPWYNVDKLFETLQLLKTFDLTQNGKAFFAKKCLHKLKSPAPFSWIVRYPYELYITELDGKWYPKFLELIAILKRFDKPNHWDVPYEMIVKNKNRLIELFPDAILVLENQLQKDRPFYYARHNFEKKFELT